MAEPLSIAVRAVHRARIAPGEKVVVLGAGPIGQCVCLLARERGRRRAARRRPAGAPPGAEPRDGRRRSGAGRILEARWSARPGDWAGGGGRRSSMDATGAAPAVRAMIDMLASAGRAVQVGMSGERGSGCRIGSFTEKEIDMVGVSCCGGGEFRRGGGGGRAQRGRTGAADQRRVPARAHARGDRACDRALRRGDEGDDPVA